MQGIEQFDEKEKKIIAYMKHELNKMGISELSRNYYYRTKFVPEDFQIININLTRLMQEDAVLMSNNTREEQVNKINKLKLLKKYTNTMVDSQNVTLKDLLGVRESDENHRVIMNIMQRTMESQTDYPYLTEIKGSKEKTKEFASMVVEMGYQKEMVEIKMRGVFDATKVEHELYDLFEKVIKEIKQIDQELTTNLYKWLNESKVIKHVMDRVGGSDIR